MVDQNATAFSSTSDEINARFSFEGSLRDYTLYLHNETVNVINETYRNETVNSYVPYYRRYETYVVPIVFSVIFLVGVIGNGTLVIIFFLNRNLRNAPNTYIISLAIGDLCVLCLSMPFVSTIYVIESWPFGLFICRFSEFFRNVSVGVTVFTLTALSADRYLAIASPFRRAKKQGPTTVNITVCLWILAILLSLPDAMTSILLEIPLNPEKIILVCYPFPEWLPVWYQKANILSKAFLFYLVPLLAITTFYILMARSLLKDSQELRGIQKQLKIRKKLAKVVLCFVCIFALCFLPNHIFLVWFYFDPHSKEKYNDFWHVLRPVGFTLSFVNSCLNPITLFLISSQFRKLFNRYLFSKICCCEYFKITDLEDCHGPTMEVPNVSIHCQIHCSMVVHPKPVREVLS